MSSYESKQEARRERLEAAADRAERESKAAFKRSNDLTAGIPMGQPILVGHHSESRHRNALDKSWKALGKGVELDKKAGELRARAASVGSAGISADDPDAASKIRAKIAELEQQRELMKAANKAYRMAKTRGIAGLPDDELQVKDVEEIRAKVGHGSFNYIKSAIQWKPNYAFEKGPFVGFPLQNLGQNITRYKKRLDALPDLDRPSYKMQIGPVEIVENPEENRTQVFFPGKPSSDVRTQLKRAGFRWAPSVGAWQRQLSHWATAEAKRIARYYEVNENAQN